MTGSKTRRVNAPRQAASYPPLSDIMLATIPVALAALMVWMVRDAIGRSMNTPPAASSRASTPRLTR
jgi:hypothetical protein